jgi:hypothetical protein
MKRNLKITLITCLALLTTNIYAGNPDRVGQAGAGQLLINSFGRSSGWGLANTAGVRGIESMFLNVGGLAHTPGTELTFSRMNYLRGSDININNFGLAQKLGSGVLGVTLQAFDIDPIQITTFDQPEGGIGTFKPQFMNIGIGYSKLFTKTISGGIVFRVISEGISDVKAMGVSLDAGVQYTTKIGDNRGVNKNNFKIGVAVKNIGPSMRYNGDGLSYKVDKDDINRTATTTSEAFQLPSLIHIGASLDIPLGEKRTNRLTPALNFTNNSFRNNQTTLGLEFASKEMVMLRVGYGYEEGTFSYDTRKNVNTGISCGATIEIPFNKEKNNSTIALDYSFSDSKPFNNTHVLGIRINLDSSTD